MKKITHRKSGPFCVKAEVKKYHKDKNGITVIDEMKLIDISIGCGKDNKKLSIAICSICNKEFSYKRKHAYQIRTTCGEHKSAFCRKIKNI